ncbi:MAG TPA: hypothetical protein PLC65_05720 [Bacteroidia bacterium]|nr:hypothetical protein [Bacteroidia bacterium]
MSLEDKDIEKKLQKLFNKSFKYKRNSKGGGSLTLNFSNDHELENILSYFGIE